MLEATRLLRDLNERGGRRVPPGAPMEALDATNRTFGKRAVVAASQGCPSTLSRTRAESGAPAWEMRRERMSPRYTTRWEEVAVALAR